MGEHLDVRAPFTEDQVALLTRFQAGGWWHPFTCGWRRHHPDNEGILVATVNGWQCPQAACSFTQDWAHWFMADADFIEAGERRHWQLFGDLMEDGDQDE